MNNTPRMHDAINCSPQSNFTQIPDDLLRNPNLSFKSKGILCLLLSNKNGWVSYIETIKSMGTDGVSAIKSTLQELEKYGYLWRISYVNKQSKKICGSFWAYTNEPNQFDIEEHLQWLEDHDFEIWSGSKNFPQVENPQVENPSAGFPSAGNPTLNIYNNKNTNSKNICAPTFSNQKSDKNQTFTSFAEQLASIIKTKKNVRITPSKIQSWANSIRLLSSQMRISPLRIQKALNWYAVHAYENQFIPIIESGEALRDKWMKLENAIRRDNGEQIEEEPEGTWFAPNYGIC